MSVQTGRLTLRLATADDPGAACDADAIGADGEPYRLSGSGGLNMVPSAFRVRPVAGNPMPAPVHLSLTAGYGVRVLPGTGYVQ